MQLTPKEKRAANIAQGLCGWGWGNCKEPLETKFLCHKHRMEHRKYKRLNSYYAGARADRKRKRLCEVAGCDRPLVNATKCAYHRQKALDRVTRADRWTYKLKCKYGLAPKNITDALIRQNGKCAICGKPPGPRRPDNLVIDHDPTTGAFRGLIHEKENRSLGVFGDNAEGVKRVLDYLLAAIDK